MSFRKDTLSRKSSSSGTGLGFGGDRAVGDLVTGLTPNPGLAAGLATSFATALVAGLATSLACVVIDACPGFGASLREGVVVVGFVVGVVTGFTTCLGASLDTGFTVLGSKAGFGVSLEDDLLGFNFKVTGATDLAEDAPRRFSPFLCSSSPSTRHESIHKLHVLKRASKSVTGLVLLWVGPLPEV